MPLDVLDHRVEGRLTVTGISRELFDLISTAENAPTKNRIGFTPGLTFELGGLQERIALRRQLFPSCLFERVALQPRSTAVRVRAEVDDLLPHDATSRCAASRRRSASPTPADITARGSPLAPTTFPSSRRSSARRASSAMTSSHPGTPGSAAGNAMALMCTGQSPMALPGSGVRCCPSCTLRSRPHGARLRPCRACCRYRYVSICQRTGAHWRRWLSLPGRPSRMLRASTS